MNHGILGRIRDLGGAATVGAAGVPVSALVDRLDAGEPPAGVARALGLGLADVVACLAHEGLVAGGPPSLVRARPRRPGLRSTLGHEALAGLWPSAKSYTKLALSAGLFQVLDFWDESHQAAQEADDLGETVVSAYWHGIAHRREPDAGNASYWFRRVGDHPVFIPLAENAREILGPEDGRPDGSNRLLARGAWDAYAFIDLATTARGDAAVAAFREIQRSEMSLLLAASLPAP